MHITPKTVHRMTAIDDCDIFEVSTPELHDVVRLEDRYGQIVIACARRQAAAAQFLDQVRRRSTRISGKLSGPGLAGPLKGFVAWEA